MPTLDFEMKLNRNNVYKILIRLCGVYRTDKQDLEVYHLIIYFEC